MKDFQLYKKEQLDTKSASFCGAKWYNATIFLNSGKTMSCHHNPYHEVSDTAVIENYKALHNTTIKKQHRAQMQKGERPADCEYCWKIEDMGNEYISDRVFRSMDFSDQDNQIAFNSDPNEDFDLQAIELYIDKTCQMACSYCHAGYSSTWANDIKNHGPYMDVETDKRNHYKYPRFTDQLFKPDQTNPYVEAFFKWWDDRLYKTVKKLKILGGEPLLSLHFWRFLEWFKKKNTGINLCIVSNFGPLVDVDKLLNSADDVKLELHISNEAVSKQAEYIRDGLEYDLWVNNVEKCLQSDNVKIISVLFTINALCYKNMIALFDKIIAWKKDYGKEKITFSLNLLRYPVFQNVLVLPADIREQFAKDLSSWFQKNTEELIDAELEQFKRIINYISKTEVPTNVIELRKDFRSFFTQYDQRRNKSFTSTFPELADWFNNL